MTYWYRFAHGDEVIFVHEGTGVFESQFGTLRYGPGDYLVIPTGILWRILPDDKVDHRMLVVESSGGHVEPPKRYLNHYGQFVESAPYGERDLRPPEELVTHEEVGEFEVRVKARGTSPATSTVTIPWMSSAGMGTSGRLPSISTTLSPSPGVSTSRRRCIRHSKVPASCCAPSCRGSSTIIPCRFLRRTTIPMSIPTR